MTPRAKWAARKRGIFFPPTIFTFASLCMQPNIWTECMKLTSKGKADTEADQADFIADSASSAHLAQTLFDLLCLEMRIWS